MIDIFTNYGNIIKQGITSPREYLEFLTKKIITKEDNQQLAILTFNMTEELISIINEKITLENNEAKSRQYLWIGNTADTTNRYITTDKCDRFFTGLDEKEKNNNPISQLYERISDSTLKTKIKRVIEVFYPEDLHFYLNFEKLSKFNEYINNQFSIIKKYQSETAKKAKADILRELQAFCSFVIKGTLIQWAENFTSTEELRKAIIAELIAIIQDQFQDETYWKEIKLKPRPLNNYFNAIMQIAGIVKEKTVLMTLSIDDAPIASDGDYVEFLYKEKLPEAIIKENHSNIKKISKSTKKSTKSTKQLNLPDSIESNLICSLCGHSGNDICADYLTKAQTKFYNTDKIIFSQQLSDNFDLSFSLCKNCFEKLALGEKYLLSQFRKKWAGKSLLLIPEITPMDNISNESLQRLAYESNQINNLLYSFEIGRKFESNIEELFEVLENKRSLVYHYLFFTQTTGGKPNKVIKIIKDVPPSRLKEILETTAHLCDLDEIKNPTPLDLRHLYYLIPIKVDKKSQPKSTDIIFILYDSILLKNPINHRLLIENFSKTIRCIILETQGLNISVNKSEFKWSDLRRKVLLMNTTLQFLEQIHSIEQLPNNSELEKIMSEHTTPDPLWDEIKKYWTNKSIYNLNQTRALFLYGLMLSNSGSAQYTKLKSEPILKKINYDGMNRDKIINLVNEIVDKLNKYKKYGYNKEIHASAQEYFENVDPRNWALTPAENVFYLMSGYVFQKEYNRKMFAQEENEASEEEETSIDEESNDQDEN